MTLNLQYIVNYSNVILKSMGSFLIWLGAFYAIQGVPYLSPLGKWAPADPCVDKAVTEESYRSYSYNNNLRSQLTGQHL